MLFPKSFFKVADNSGAKYGRCLKILRTVSAYGKQKHARVGDLVLISVRFCVPHKRVKKGEIYTALIIRSRAFLRRTVNQIFFWENAVILLDKKLQPFGTRVFGPVGREVRVKKYNKLSIMAKFMV
jgi:large subunit ribosomal protein L14